MKLEQQVCSLELAKKLKELGVKQKSEFNWVQDDENENPEEWFLVRPLYVQAHKPDPVYSAFTVAELGEMLPEAIYRDGDGREFLYTWKDDLNQWRVHYARWGETPPYLINKISTEADARATMLVYLLENKLITPATSAGE